MSSMVAGRGRGRIRPPRRGMNQGEAIDFAGTWGVLEVSLREIHHRDASKLSFEQIYRYAYKLVLKKEGEQLYRCVKEFEKGFLRQMVLPRINIAMPAGIFAEGDSSEASKNVNERWVAGEKFMKSLKNEWEDYVLCMNMITDVLMYMDRVYCQENNKASVFSASMGLFRENILWAVVSESGNDNYAALLYKVVLDQIQMERAGDVIDKSLIRTVTYMLESLFTNEREEEQLRLYQVDFEPLFLSRSRDFYKAEAQQLLRTVDASTYCRNAKKRLNEESDRCRTTLSISTLTKIRAVVDEELIKTSMREIIAMPGSGVQFMLEHERLSDLQLLYELIARVDPKMEELKQAIQSRIVELGVEVNAAATAVAQVQPVKPSADPAEKAAVDRSVNQQTTAALAWMDDVLRLKTKFDNVLERAFEGDKGLQTSITQSFTKFINDFPRSSEYLSLFFDENMKKGIKGKTEIEVDILLDRGITLLRYIQDKDMFERYYKRHLSKRLLMKRSISMDAERQMVLKMKMEVGTTFTQRIESMFKDMAISEDLTSGYKEYVAQLGDRDTKRAELDVTVLTSTMWPPEVMNSANREGESIGACIYPSSIEVIRHGFQKYYLDKHSGRKLTWQGGMGTADIRTYFPKTKGNTKYRELNVSTYAMLILLLFNDKPSDFSLTTEEIQANTNIPTAELSRNLQSLSVVPKTRVLIKEPMSKDIKITDRFSFNEAFQSPFNKIKIGVVSNANRVESVEERKETENKNNDIRQNIIEAAIVRIMKSRQVLTHQQLITEVIQTLTSRFVPDVTMVKKRIESLIEREYLDRIEEAERPSYRYLA